MTKWSVLRLKMSWIFIYTGWTTINTTIIHWPIRRSLCIFTSHVGTSISEYNCFDASAGVMEFRNGWFFSMKCPVMDEYQLVNIICFFLCVDYLQHQLSRCHIIVNNIATGFAYECLVSNNTKKSTPYIAIGLIFTETSSTNSQVPLIARCKYKQQILSFGFH